MTLPYAGTWRFPSLASVFLTVTFLGGVIAFLAMTKNSEQGMLIGNQRWRSFQSRASGEFIVFPAVLSAQATGLVWIDRSTHMKKLIRVDGADLFSPSISDDGQRLLFVKRNAHSSSREIVRCTIVSWQCQVLFALDKAVESPIEIGDGDVLLGASDLTKRPDGQERYDNFDFYHFDSGTNAVTKLAEFGFYSLTTLQYVKPTVYFSALRLIPEKQDSEIFSQEFDEKKKRFVEPQPLEPHFFLKGGKTTDVSCSDRCRLMAFLYLAGRYKLVIVRSGAVPEVVETKALGMSKPTVVGDDVIVNELFENEYVVSAYRLGRPSEVLERLPNSPRDLEKLEAISLAFDK